MTVQTPSTPDDLPAPFDGDGFQSFTGPASVRYPALDIARGFMLLLIALANAPFWMVLFRTRAEVTGADTIWMGLRAAFVDHRSYPLFAMLFGFGLADVLETDRSDLANPLDRVYSQALSRATSRLIVLTFNFE